VTSGLLVTAHAEGGLYVWSDLDGTLVRNLKGHVADINSVRFFPSGTVLLSGGADMILKIWTLAQEGLCAAELKGHTRGILSTGIIERGRNIVSTSRDGTAILWDVPSQSIIYRWGDSQNANAANDCHVAHSVPCGGPSLDERDVGTDGKILYIGTESGKLLGYDMRERREVFCTKEKSAINAVTSLPSTSYLISGLHDGTVSCWDVRKFDSPTHSLQASLVTRLLPSASTETQCGCWVSCGDGSVFNWDLKKQEISLSLVGDTEPINALLQRSNDIISVSRVGTVRAYSTKLE